MRQMRNPHTDKWVSEHAAPQPPMSKAHPGLMGDSAFKVSDGNSNGSIPIELHGLIEFLAELMAEEFLKENGIL